MGRKEKFRFKANVSLPEELGEWLEAQVKAGIFSSVSHGIRKCVAEAKGRHDSAGE
jgi:Arc/MetJ-type ribon-helix-helix transcriptional regulator